MKVPNAGDGVEADGDGIAVRVVIEGSGLLHPHQAGHADGRQQVVTVLAAYISGRGTFHTPQLEAAFRTVPRHLFLPAWT